MRIYFCPDCGVHSLNPRPICEECHGDIPEDNWADVTDEDLRELRYVDEMDFPPGMPTWEYDVVRFKTDTKDGGLCYTTQLLNRMGDKGWELVDIVILGGKDGSRYGVFKRAWDVEYQ